MNSAALLRFDHSTIRHLRRPQWLRELARKSLGPQTYLRLKRLVTA
jgi:hypothetical protein